MLLKLALLVLMVVLVAKLFRRRKGKPSAPLRTEIDRWVDQELTRELARKLAIEQDGVRKSLNGEPDPDIVGAIEQAVRTVEVCYAKGALGGEVEVRLDVTFEDGTSFTTSRLLPMTEIPGPVREEYGKTGAARVYRPYLFPWSNA